MKKKWIVFIVVSVFVLCSVVPAMAVESTWHGQFRINYYSMSQDEDVGPGTAAARLRWRPTWDVKVNNDVSMHMQLNIGHIDSNASNARFDKGGSASVNTSTSTANCTDGSDVGATIEPYECVYSSTVSNGAPAVAIRHAVLNFTPPEIGGKLSAGLVPMSDKFGDTLFSGDWDFNPLSLVWMTKFDNIDVRLATGKLMETDPSKDDDLDAYLADVDLPMGNGTVGGSIYMFRSGDGLAGALGDTVTQNYIGVRAAQDVGFAKVNGFFVYNKGKIEKCSDSFCSGATVGDDVDNSGYAIKLEGTKPVGSANVGLMFIMTSGDKEIRSTDSASSFITPMTLIAHTGYWGYTGKLNVQGPTDTGIDNPLNIDGAAYSTGSGVGYGIMTVQAKADFPITNRLDGYAAIGIFQHQDVRSGSDKSIGTDVYVQGKYNIAQNLNLEAGLDYASIGKKNEAYLDSTTGALVTVDNTVMLLVARLQLEY